MTAYLNHSNMFASTLAYFSPPIVNGVSDYKSYDCKIMLGFRLVARFWIEKVESETLFSNL